MLTIFNSRKAFRININLEYRQFTDYKYPEILAAKHQAKFSAFLHDRGDC